jgi:hypothetical protein
MNLWQRLFYTHRREDPMNAPERDAAQQAATIMSKIKELDEGIATLRARVPELEVQLTVALTEDFSGGGDRAAQIEPLRADLARTKAQLAEKYAIIPHLIDMLQAERTDRREAWIKDAAELIARAGIRQDECNREIVQLRAAFEAACKPLEQERSDMQDEVLRLTQPMVQLRQGQAAWRGSLVEMEALLHDEACEIRPDELERVLDEWRAQERREQSRIVQVELGFERSTGRITSATIAGKLTREQIREERIIAKEREALAACRASRVGTSVA